MAVTVVVRGLSDQSRGKPDERILREHGDAGNARSGTQTFSLCGKRVCNPPVSFSGQNVRWPHRLQACVPIVSSNPGTNYGLGGAGGAGGFGSAWAVHDDARGEITGVEIGIRLLFFVRILSISFRKILRTFAIKCGNETVWAVRTRPRDIISRPGDLVARPEIRFPKPEYSFPPSENAFGDAKTPLRVDKLPFWRCAVFAASPAVCVGHHHLPHRQL
jgi:hypothetical protein